MHTWIVHCAASTAVIYKCCFNTRNVCCAVLEEIYLWSLWTVDSACLITGGNPVCRISCALGYLELNLSLKGRWVSFRKSWGWRDGVGAAGRAVQGAGTVLGTSLRKKLLWPFFHLSGLSRLPECKSCKQNKRERRMKTKPLLKSERKLVLVRGLSNREKRVIHLAK